MLTMEMMHKERKRVPRAPTIDIATVRSPDEEAPTEPTIPHADLALKYTIEINTSTVIADDVMSTNPEVDFESIADKDAWYSIKRFVYGEIKDELLPLIRKLQGVDVWRPVHDSESLRRRDQDKRTLENALEQLKALAAKL